MHPLPAPNAVIADDERLMRVQIIARLKEAWPELSVVGEASNGHEAVALVQSLEPDIVFLDISMPGMDGLAVARRLRTQVPSARIVVMSQHDPDILLPLALAAGADGCLDKSRLKQDILSTIERVTSAIKKDAGPDLPLPKPA